MTKKYNFDPLEDGEYVIADPVGQGDPIRLEAKWVEGEEIEGEWERAIGAVIKEDLLGEMNLEDGNGKISRRRMVETLASVEDDKGPIVTSEEQADALVGYFADEEIVELDDSGNVLILQNPQETAEVNGKMVLNWAAGIEACVEKISETQDRIKAAKEKLENRLDDIDQDPGHIEEKARETAQELKSLGDGPGVPENPSDLPPDEQSRYNELKRDLIYHNKMMDVVDTDLTEKVKEGTNKLGKSLGQLDSARTALSQKQGEFRTVALDQQEFPEGADNITQNMGKLATTLAGVGDVDEAVENTDPTEVADIVGKVTGDAAEVANTASETAGEDEKKQVSGELGQSG